MADAFRWNQARFVDRLATRDFGFLTFALPEVESTNDEAIESFEDDLPHGVTIVAGAQTRGRGRSGRSWSQVPGAGLAMSFAFHARGAAGSLALVPLAAGLAVARAAGVFGVRASLKWPNDVLVGGRKLAGVLCEMRRGASGEVVVVGVGMNVRHAAADFPAELRETATSLAIAGADVALEDAAAEVLNAFEPLWEALQRGERAAVLDAWSERAAFWGEPVTVRTPAGPVTGVAQRLDPGGGLVLRLEGGAETTVLAGDVEPGVPVGREP